jgi:PAT family beta-lactamase induction signal transducer AmpG
MAGERMRVSRNLPVWLLGMTNIPIGVTGAVGLLIAPQVLAARHVPEGTIADITTLGLISNLVFFLVAPLLDVRFSRRSYALGLSLATGVLTFATVATNFAVGELGVLLFLCMLAAALNLSAIGGWFGSVLPREYDAPLGAWMIVANVGGFGISSILGIFLIETYPIWVAAIALGSINLLPLFVILWVQPPTEKRRKIGESFARFGNELLQVARRSQVRRLLLLLALPCASFALTNTLGGLGGDYSASPKLVAAFAGAGVTLAGLLGSLVVPGLNRRYPLLAMYIAIGILGGTCTLSLILLPHSPLIFAFALFSQNVWQAASFATATALMLTSIGKNNPLASTQFAFLTAAQATPLAYMQWIDGHSYSATGLTGLYLADGGLGVAASGFIGLLFMTFWKRSKPDGNPGAERLPTLAT